MDAERCEICGFDATRLGTTDAVAALRSMGRRWADLFKDVPEDRLRQRPEPATWSPLEYAGHTRDVLMILGRAVGQALEGERPELPSLEPEQQSDRYYNDLDPRPVVDDLGHRASGIADRAEQALAQHWQRTALVAGEEADAGWLLRHAVHEATHHLRDAQGALGAVPEA